MPVKTEPVPVSEQPEDKEKEAEPEEAAQEEVPKAQPKRRAKKAVIEAPEEPLPAEPEVHEEPKPKARAKRAPKAKAEPKEPSAARGGSAAKPKKEPKPSAARGGPAAKATKQDCTVCNTPVSSEALLTSHECSKSALAAKKKKVTLEEQAPPPPLVRQPAPRTAREMANWVQEHPNEAFPYETEMPQAQQYGAPPTFVGDFAAGIGDLTIPERRLTYREALENKYREYQHQKRASMVGPLRRAYGQ